MTARIFSIIHKALDEIKDETLRGRLTVEVELSVVDYLRQNLQCIYIELENNALDCPKCGFNPGGKAAVNIVEATAKRMGLIYGDKLK